MEKVKIQKKKKAKKGDDEAMEGVTKTITKGERNSKNKELKMKSKRKKSRSQARF